CEMLMGDKAFDADGVLETVAERGATAVIPVPFELAFWLSFWGRSAAVCAGAALHPSAEGWRAEKSS
ncbi:MAG: hypothetical protein OXE84_13585, partial [Rhodobacteraceae bacterium]|nr:hypothetical protein [Paracoccaceae bacterium]